MVNYVSGAEVAQYCAMHFPDYVKKVDAYKEGNVKQALEDAFLQFDSTLIEESVVKELRALAGDDDRNAEEEEGKLLFCQFTETF